MDPVTIIAFTTSIVQLATAFHRPNERPTRIWSVSGTCFLSVLEIPLDGSKGKCIATTTSSNDIDLLLTDLPPLRSGVIRIYIEELPDTDILRLVKHLQPILGDDKAREIESSKFLENSHEQNSVSTLVSQWHLHPQRLRTSNLVPATAPRKLKFRDPQSKLREIPRLPLPSYIEMKTDFHCMSLGSENEEDEHPTIILISSQSSTKDFSTSSKEQALLKVLGGYQRHLLEMHLYLEPGESFADRRRTMIQLLLMQYFRGHSEHNGRLMSMIGANYSQKQREHMDPRQIALTSSVLEELMADAFHYDDIREKSRVVADLLGSLVEIVSESTKETWVNSSSVRRLCSEVREECRAQTSMAGRITERFEVQMKFMERFRSLRDSVSIGLLTLLAAIFLPLSIATGILSMQTRFVNLHFLLYDFCGVIVIIGSLITTVFITLKS